MKAHDIHNVTELIAALRCDGKCNKPNCPYSMDDRDWCDEVRIISDAADALEAAEAQIAKLEAKEPTEKQVVDYCHKRCLVIIEEELFHKMKSKYSQLSKEGEWIEAHDWLQIPQEERGTYRCSACGQVMKYPWNYCPNCGAKMQTVTECHTLEEGER